MPDTPLNPDALKWLTYIEDAIKDAGYNCNCTTTPDNVSIDKDWIDYHLRELKKVLLAAAPPELQANSKPNQNLEFVNSVEELDALPVQSVIEDAGGSVFEVTHNGERNSDGTFYREYLMTGDIHAYSIEEIDLPATVLKRAPETPRR